ncbi:uncharacterized protein LOC144119065 isoform X1 [Amblyomma americanum]
MYVPRNKISVPSLCMRAMRCFPVVFNCSLLRRVKQTVTLSAYPPSSTATVKKSKQAPKSSDEDEARKVATMSELGHNNESKLPPQLPHQLYSNDSGYCSAEQWAVMLDFLCVHTGLGRDTNELRPETRQRLWSEMTSLLNALGPASRSREEWRRYWQNRVTAARKRASEMAATELSAASSSDGRPSMSVGLLEEDARVLSVVGDEVSLEVFQGHVVQKRREHVHSGCSSPALSPASPTNAPTDKSPLQHRASDAALQQCGSPSAEKAPSATSESDRQEKPYSSTQKSISLTSLGQSSDRSCEQLADNQGGIADLKGEEEVSDDQFRSQVLRHLQQVEATAQQLQAVSDRQAQVVNGLTTTLQRVLRLLADRLRPLS